MSNCHLQGWSVPVPISADGEGPVARFPRLAVGSNSVYVVGVDIQVFDNRNISESPLVVWELGGKSLGRPPGRFSFLFPRAAVDSHGRLHLLWAEPASLVAPVQARSWYFLRPFAIWSASFDRRDGWSEPTQIDHRAKGPEGLKWTAPGTADNLGDQRYRSIGLPYLRPGRNDQLLYLTLDQDATWKRRWIPVPRGSAYVSVVFDNTNVFVAYVDTDSAWAASPLNPTHADVNSVFALVSHDGGVTWAAPVLVSRSGQFPAHQVHALLGPKGELHLIWKQEKPGGAVARHVVSSDGARTWSGPHDMVVPGKFDNLRATIDHCGTVHLVYEDWAAGVDRIHIDYAAWNENWSKPLHLFDTMLAMTPDVRIGERGDPLLVFVARKLTTTGTAIYRTYYSRLARKQTPTPQR